MRLRRVIAVVGSLSLFLLGYFLVTSGGVDEWKNARGEDISESVISDRSGPAHCDWQSTTWLTYLGEKYVRDPNHVLPKNGSVVSFIANADLPNDAQSTGLRKEDFELWTSASHSNKAVFLGDSNGVEQWPRATAGCA